MSVSVNEVSVNECKCEWVFMWMGVCVNECFCEWVFMWMGVCVNECLWLNSELNDTVYKCSDSLCTYLTCYECVSCMYIVIE